MPTGVGGEGQEASCQVCSASDTQVTACPQHTLAQGLVCADTLLQDNEIFTEKPRSWTDLQHEWKQLVLGNRGPVLH